MNDDYIGLARAILAEHNPRTLDVSAANEAAVLVLLYHMAGTEHVLFTMRTDTVEHHKSQISFPGGARHDADEDLATTALRETWEEVGVTPEDVEIIGRLDQMITTSNFRVTPYVGVLRHAPYEFVPSPDEVAEVLEVPLRHLLDPTNKTMERRQRPDGAEWFSPEYWHNDHRIWGATARMLEGFLEILAAEEPTRG